MTHLGCGQKIHAGRIPEKPFILFYILTPTKTKNEIRPGMIVTPKTDFMAMTGVFKQRYTDINKL